MVKLPPSYIVANQCISVSPGIDLTQCRIRGSLTRKKSSLSYHSNAKFYQAYYSTHCVKTHHLLGKILLSKHTCVANTFVETLTLIWQTLLGLKLVMQTLVWQTLMRW